MVNPWVTTIVIVFGVIVAVACVFAYLRIYRSSGERDSMQDRQESAAAADANCPPSEGFSAVETVHNEER